MPDGFSQLALEARGERELSQAADLLRGSSHRWHVIYHNDGDGVASASVASHLLHRLGHPFRLTPLVGLEVQRLAHLMEEAQGPLLVLDTGSSYLSTLAHHRYPVVVLDHHIPPPSAEGPAASLAFVNPHHWGVDGMVELSASMLTFLLALSMNEQNLDLGIWGLSGAIADRQHVGGFRGLNGRLVELLEARGILRRRRVLALRGSNLVEALTRSLDPYYTGLTGRPERVREWLSRLGVPVAVPPEELAEDARERLASALLGRLLQQKARPEFCENVTETRYEFPAQGQEALEISRWQNATAREGQASIGLALAWGNRSAKDQAQALERAWEEGVLSGLRALEEPGAVHRQGSIQWFETPATSLAGTIAGLAITYFLDPTRPVFSFSPSGSGVKVSARGSLWLTGQGLDLATVCRQAARKVGGEGGGHRVASGATIPKGREEDFLTEADRLVSAQLVRLVPASVT
jgi:single-stranded-DNA-specific exonuclease